MAATALVSEVSGEHRGRRCLKSWPEAVAVQLAFQIGGDGGTNWLGGVLFPLVCVILGILFFYLPLAHAAG